MGGTEPGSAREEAERLVATALAVARLAASERAVRGAFGTLGDAIVGALGSAGEAGTSGGSGPSGERRAGHTGLATGSAACCVCPICRLIAALRDPSPEFAERLATGAGDLAAGVASLMRSFAAPAPPSQRGPQQSPRPSAAPPDDAVWSAATRTGDHAPPPAREQDVWAAATGAPDQDVWAAATSVPDQDVWTAATSADAANRPGDADGSSGVGWSDAVGYSAPGRQAGDKPMARKAVKRPGGDADRSGVETEAGENPEPGTKAEG
jgi:hypothetical protein